LAEVTILRFRWDANNSAHCAARNVWDDDFEDALESGEWSLVPNKRGMAATHLFIFRNRSGRVITAPIVETGDPGVWRAISAWDAKPSEARRLR
jgi:hypothetical protein